MSIRVSESGPTSNDLLSRLAARQPAPALSDQVVAQNVENVSNVENAPAVNRET